MKGLIAAGLGPRPRDRYDSRTPVASNPGAHGRAVTDLRHFPRSFFPYDLCRARRSRHSMRPAGNTTG